MYLFSHTPVGHTLEECERTDFGAFPLAVCVKLRGPLLRAVTLPAELSASVKRNISTSFEK